MTPEERQTAVDRICEGFAYGVFSDVVVKVFDPTAVTRHLAEQHATQYRDSLLRSGVATNAEIEALLCEKGLWSDENERQITLAKEDIQAFREELPRYEFQSNAKALLEKKINLAEQHLQKLLSAKHALSGISVEHLASIAKYKYLLFLNVYDVNNKRIWGDFGAFQSEPDSIINKLLNNTYLSKEFGEVEIRELARNEPWRSTWITAQKVGGSLFNLPLTQSTDYQRALATWSLIYDSVYENPDCPADDVIENDTLLDAWLSAQQTKRRQSRDQRGADAIISKNPKIANAQEVGIICDSQEDAMRVYNLNSPDAKRRIKSREAALKEKGRLHEGQLPDVKFDIGLKINQMKSAKEQRGR